MSKQKCGYISDKASSPKLQEILGGGNERELDLFLLVGINHVLLTAPILQL